MKKKIIFFIIVLCSILFINYVHAENNVDESYKFDDSRAFDRGSMEKSRMSEFSKLRIPHEGEIFNLGKVAIKFIPPEGWDLYEFGPGCDQCHELYFFPEHTSDIRLNIRLTFFSNKNHPALESILDSKKQDKFCSNQQFITFAGFRALSFIEKLGISWAKKIIIFDKDNLHFEISFMAPREDFDKLLPIVDTSLKSFEVLGGFPPQGRHKTEATR